MISREMNKKGDLPDYAVKLGIAILMLFALLVFIRVYIIDKGTVGFDAMNTCGSLTSGRGTCKLSCDADTEMEYQNIGGCEKSEKCCALIDGDIRDVLLPGAFGGDAEYDISVDSIKFTEIGSCKYEPNADGDQHTILCKPRMGYKFTIETEVTNTGTESIKVYSVPVVVTSGNEDTIKPVGTYVSKDASEIPTGGSLNSAVQIAVSSSESASGNYITIYPYAKCETRQCKRTDEKSRGILSRAEDGSEEYLTIKFEPDVAVTT